MKAIILAAGKGTRMLTNHPKVMHEVAFRPMIYHVINSIYQLAESGKTKEQLSEIVVVIGFKSSIVEEYINSIKPLFPNTTISTALQDQQLGTGHAVKVGVDFIFDEHHHMKIDENILITYGDMPLITPDTYASLIKGAKPNAVNCISTTIDNPTGYGRIIRDTTGNVLKIVEEKDSNESERKINEVNTGVMFVHCQMLASELKNLKNDNKAKEYYLTDLVVKGSNAINISNTTDFNGINDQKQLTKANSIMHERINEKLLTQGIRMLNPATIFIDNTTTIQHNSYIQQNVIITNSKIGKNVTIHQGCRIEDSIIEDDTVLLEGSIIIHSQIGKSSTIGPYTHFRRDVIVGEKSKIGNFTELKNVTMGSKNSIAHLTYLGDAEIGSGNNFGCGVITCNYDGSKDKKHTTIGDNVFIGSDVQFVAPVKIASNTVIASGTTVTKDIAEDSLAIARTEQKSVDGYYSKKFIPKIKRMNADFESKKQNKK